MWRMDRNYNYTMYIYIKTEFDNIVIEESFGIIVRAPKKFDWMIGLDVDEVRKDLSYKGILIEWRKLS